MLISLAIAFMVTPWLARLLLRPRRTRGTRPTAGAAGALARAALSRASSRPFLDDARGGAQPLLLGLGDRGADRAVAGAAGVPAGRAEDAAVRQQVRVPGRRRHAGGHAARKHRGGAARDGRRPRDGARGHRLPGLRRHRGADQLQRPGAPVLPAPRRRRRRPAGQSRRQARIAATRATRSRRACARSWTKIADALRRARQGGRGAARAAGAVADRRRDLRARRRRPHAQSPRPCARAFARTAGWSTSTTARSPSAAQCSRRPAQGGAAGRLASRTIVATLRAGLAGEATSPTCTTRRKYPAACALQLPADRARRARRAAAAHGAQRRGPAGAAPRAGDGRPTALREQPRLSQGPAAGGLRGRRRRRRHRQPALRHVRDAQRRSSRIADAGRRHAGRALHHASRDDPYRGYAHQVGRRVAGHLRDVPRHGRSPTPSAWC